MSLDNNNIINYCVHKISVNFISENTTMLSTVIGEAKCDYLTTVQQLPAVFLVEYFVIVHPRPPGRHIGIDG